MAVIRRDFLPQHLQHALAQAGYQGCVAVQAPQSEDETRFLLELAGQYPFIRGVVGWVDLQAENVAERLAYFSHFPKLSGFRHIVQAEPDEQFLLRPAFREGIKRLRTYRFTYDILIYPQQLPVAAKFVQQFPDQPFVVDHLAKPFIKDKQLEPWAADLKKLAAYENVCCKLSGMVTEADWQHWRPADFIPYLEVALEAFGPHRLMIGSDWPVCQVAGSYGRVMQIVEEYITRLTPHEQALILGENAIRFYHL